MIRPRCAVGIEKNQTVNVLNIVQLTGFHVAFKQVNVRLNLLCFNIYSSCACGVVTSLV